jgi:uncharacterized protein
MRQVDPRSGIHVLDRDECLCLLAGEQVGRLAVVEHDRPKIYPVNYALDGDEVVFRSDLGAKVDAGHRAPVCFEVDHLNARTRAGWSVVITGRLEDARGHDLPIEPWAGAKQHQFRIVSERITGRRVGPPD